MFTVLGLQGVPVKVDTIVVDLLHTPEETIIARTLTIPFEETPGAQTCDTSSKWSLCRFRAIVVARLQAIMEAARARASSATKGWGSQTEDEGEQPKRKGCGRKGPGRFGGLSPFNGPHGGQRHGPPSAFPGRHGGPPNGFHGPPHHGPHGPHGSHHHSHHGHHQFHRFGHMMHQTLRFFVIPALLGVIGGLVASAVGMIVGHCISYLWIRLHRGGVRGNATGRDIRVVEIVVEEDEKDALMVDEQSIQSPPEYRDVEAGLEEKQ